MSASSQSVEIYKQLLLYLEWSDEHLASFERYRTENQIAAEHELHCLKDAINNAIRYAHELKLVLPVDPPS